MDTEMRDELRNLRDQVIGGHEKLSAKIDGMGTTLHTRIESAQTQLNSRIDGMSEQFNNHKLDSATKHEKVSAKTEAAHRRMDEHMKVHWWTMGIVGTVVGSIMVYLVMTLIKLAAAAKAPQ